MSKVEFWKVNAVKGSIYGGLIFGAVFVILRVTGVTGWSWWAVTAPLWAMIPQWAMAALIIYGVAKGRGRDEVEAYVRISGIINIAIIFAVLRATSVVDWSGWIIAIPLFIGGGLMLLTMWGFAMHRRAAEKRDAK